MCGAISPLKLSTLQSFRDSWDDFTLVDRCWQCVLLYLLSYISTVTTDPVHYTSVAFSLYLHCEIDTSNMSLAFEFPGQV